MKTKLKYIFALILVVIMSAVIIAGCKKNSSNVEDQTSNQEVIEYLQNRYSSSPEGSNTNTSVNDYDVKVENGILSKSYDGVTIAANNKADFGYWKSTDGSIYSTNPVLKINSRDITSNLNLTAVDSHVGFVFVTMEDYSEQYSTSSLYDFDTILADNHTAIAYTIKNERSLQYGIIPIGTQTDNGNTKTIFNVILRYKNTEKVARQFGIVFEVDGVRKVHFFTPDAAPLTLRGISEISIRDAYTFRFNMIAID